MRVLIHQEDEAVARSIELLLTYADMNVYVVLDADEAVDLLKLYDYDMALVEDVDILMHARRARVTTSVMLVSSDDSTAAKLQAFGQGADDYLTKPFHREELVCRVNAIVRRAAGHAHAKVVTGRLTLNLTDKTAQCEGETIHLTGKEYQMLELLSLRKGTTLTKEMFLNHLYGGIDEPELKIVDVFICKLRKKLHQATGEHVIETVWGRGYVLRDPAS